MRCGAGMQKHITNKSRDAHLIQDTHSNAWHTVHVLCKHLLQQRRNVAHYFLRVHALDAGQHFGKYLASVVLHERGSNSRQRQARLQEVESAFKDAIITRREGHLT